MIGMKPEKVRVVDRKEHVSLGEFADTLELIAKKLREDGSFNLIEGTKETLITPGNKLEVEYSYTTRGDKHEFEIEFEWNDGEDQATMSIG